jgi:hypothetical protein
MSDPNTAHSSKDDERASTRPLQANPPAAPDQARTAPQPNSSPPPGRQPLFRR